MTLPPGYMLGDASGWRHHVLTGYDWPKVERLYAAHRRSVPIRCGDRRRASLSVATKRCAHWRRLVPCNLLVQSQLGFFASPLHAERVPCSTLTVHPCLPFSCSSFFDPSCATSYGRPPLQLARWLDGRLYLSGAGTPILYVVCHGGTSE